MSKLEVINVADMKEVGTFTFSFPEGITNEKFTQMILETGHDRCGDIYYDDKNSSYYYAYRLDIWYGWDEWTSSNFAVIIPNECIYNIELKDVIPPEN